MEVCEDEESRRYCSLFVLRHLPQQAHTFPPSPLSGALHSRWAKCGLAKRTGRCAKSQMKSGTSHDKSCTQITYTMDANTPI